MSAVENTRLRRFCHLEPQEAWASCWPWIPFSNLWNHGKGRNSFQWMLCPGGLVSQLRDTKTKKPPILRGWWQRHINCPRRKCFISYLGQRAYGLCPAWLDARWTSWKRVKIKSFHELQKNTMKKHFQCCRSDRSRREFPTVQSYFTSRFFYKGGCWIFLRAFVLFVFRFLWTVFYHSRQYPSHLSLSLLLLFSLPLSLRWGFMSLKLSV